jgi:hypothetical protein
MPDLYTDGGVIGRNPSTIGGTWAWRRVERYETTSDAGVIEARGAYPTISNNMTELLALVKGLEALPEGWSGRVCSDSKIALGWVFWGYRRTLAVPSLCARADAAVARLGRLVPVLHDGHPTRDQLAAGVGKRGNPVSEHNAFCDKECNRVGAEFLARLNQ